MCMYSVMYVMLYLNIDCGMDAMFRLRLSSEAHRFAYKGICFDQLNDESSYNPIYAYGQSKLANILHAKELTKHFKENGVNITANALHPGSIATNLLRYHNIINGSSNYMLCRVAPTS
ncbi:hypothetical protein L1987_56238 [Smallanthus sonchifolius]|uniref:Uncharacterized protein n=1 Tax=Smallanthus sonchifolius TaxID=185202 RepID=A0ACB9ECX1_9ASTR|nr:hypothetical protein L1987_56238 [Smallanthus sonchifolius]